MIIWHNTPSKYAWLSTRIELIAYSGSSAIASSIAINCLSSSELASSNTKIVSSSHISTC